MESFINANIFNIDMAIISQDENGQIWIIRVMDTNLKNIRLDILR